MRPTAADLQFASMKRHPGVMLSVSLSLGLSICTSACHSPPAVNPWRDDSIPASTWTTPSEQGILAAGHQPAIRHRAIESSAAPSVSEEVPHFPIWWEDPFEDQGDLDGRFAWTWQDYLAMPYSYARMHLNTVGWPVSAYVDRPWQSMVSDGRFGPDRPHDAKPGPSPDPTAGPTDFGVEDPTAPHSAGAEELPATAPAGGAE